MEAFKECILQVIAEQQEQGRIPELSPEKQKRIEEEVDRQLEELKKMLDEAGLSVAKHLQNLTGLFQAMDQKAWKAPDRAMKRHWRQRELTQRKGRRNQKQRKRA